MQPRLLAVDAVAVQQQVGVAVFVVGEAVAEGVQHWDLQEAMCPARPGPHVHIRHLHLQPPGIHLLPYIFQVLLPSHCPCLKARQLLLPLLLAQHSCARLATAGNHSCAAVRLKWMTRVIEPSW